MIPHGIMTALGIYLRPSVYSKPEIYFCCNAMYIQGRIPFARGAVIMPA